MKRTIVAFLLNKGVKPNYKGYDYLVYILDATTRSDKRVPVGVLYKMAAEKFEVSLDQVERCIRTIVNNYFNEMKNPPRYRYTNSEFINLCTEELRLLCEFPLNALPNDSREEDLQNV